MAKIYIKMSFFGSKLLKIPLKITDFREVLESFKLRNNGKKLTPLLGKNRKILVLFTPAFLTPALITPRTQK